MFGSSPELAAEALACVREAGHRAAVVTTGGQDAQDYRSLGCAEVVHVQGGNPLPEAYAADVAALLEERAACAFVVCGDATGRDMAARVAGILDAPMVSEASKLHIDGGGMSASRLAYGGAVVRCERIEGFGVVSVAPGAWAPLASDGAEAPIVAVDGNPDARMQLVEVQPLEKGGADLTKAERIVCAGMAFSTETSWGRLFAWRARWAPRWAARAALPRTITGSQATSAFPARRWRRSSMWAWAFRARCSTRWASAARRWSWR